MVQKRRRHQRRRAERLQLHGGELGRTCYLNTKYCGDPRYLSMRNFALTGSAIRRDFMFDEIPNKLEPFNFDAFRNSPMRLTTVASNLETGEADYHVMKDAHDERDLLYLQASASMPLVSKIIEVDGKKLLDGGPCDSVPLLHCILDGVGDKAHRRADAGCYLYKEPEQDHAAAFTGSIATIPLSQSAWSIAISNTTARTDGFESCITKARCS